MRKRPAAKGIILRRGLFLCSNKILIISASYTGDDEAGGLNPTSL